MKNRQIDKILKPNRVLIIITIIVIIVTSVLIGTAIYIRYEEKKETKNLGELIENYEDEKGKYAKINVASIPYKITNESEDKGYYFVFDSEGYMYIVNITNKTYKKLVQMYNNGEEKDTYELKGYLFKIPSEVKKLAINVGNKMFNEKNMTSSNLSDYIGNVYLDETEMAKNNTVNLLYLISILGGIIAFLLVISSILQVKRLRKITSNKQLMKDLRKELEMLIDDSYKKQKLYLTDKYIISKTKGIEIFEYKDIIWEYSQVRYVNGIAQGKLLILCTKDKKKHSVAKAGANDACIDEIIAEIKDKNSKVRIGFTKDNREYFRKLKKENV